MTPFGEAPPSLLGCSGDCEEFRGAVWQDIRLTNVHVAVSAADGPRLKNLATDSGSIPSSCRYAAPATPQLTINTQLEGRKTFYRHIINLWCDNFYSLKSLLVIVWAVKKEKKESMHPFPLPGYCKLWWTGEKINRFFIPYRNVQERATAKHACDGCENVERICILSGILLWHPVFEDLFLMLCTHSTPLTYA